MTDGHSASDCALLVPLHGGFDRLRAHLVCRIYLSVTVKNVFTASEVAAAAAPLQA
jgi:hypothetical protein